MNESANDSGDNEPCMDEHLLDLMISQATEGLDPEQERELQRLLKESGMDDEAKKIEAAVVAFELASAEFEDVEIPDAVRDKLLIQAGRYFHGAESESEPISSEPLPAEYGTVEYGTITRPDSAQTASQSELNRSSTTSSARLGLREVVAWATAAACLVFGFWAWNTQSETKSVDSIGGIKRVDAATDVQTAQWLGVHNPQTVGQIVWSQGQQAGYMVFENLPINDPSKQQYQLWIFDGDVNQEVPVDGGVFDIANTKTTIMFSAMHRVNKAVQFAVTIEQPGGVQRSKREKIAVVATLPGAEATGPPTDLPPEEEDTVNWQPADTIRVAGLARVQASRVRPRSLATPAT